MFLVLPRAKSSRLGEHRVEGRRVVVVVVVVVEAGAGAGDMGHWKRESLLYYPALPYIALHCLASPCVAHPPAVDDGKQ